MGLTQQHAQAWKFIKSQVAKVHDPDLRMAMMAELRKRALNDWGFNPENGKLATNDDAVLDGWEKDFAGCIQKTVSFELDVRKPQREAELHEARCRMRHFVENGGELMEIPEEIRTPFITQLYYEAVQWYGDQLVEARNATTN